MRKVERSIDDYQDILDISRPKSLNRPLMERSKRAAQFAPFSAVVGYDTAVGELARYTQEKKILDETQKSIIDETLRKIEQKLQQIGAAKVKIVFFEADRYKEGGQYVTHIGDVEKIDVFNQKISLVGKDKINIDDVYSIDMQ